MEDISRELEREIALSKPKPYKKDPKTRVLVVDDFGQMRSGEYLKTLVRLLSVVSLVCFVAAGLFYYLYAGLSRETRDINNRVAVAEKKVARLTQEKEVLMARLVISGQEPGGMGNESVQKDTPGSKPIEEKKPLVSKHPEIKPTPPEPEAEVAPEKILAVADPEQAPVAGESNAKEAPPSVSSEDGPVKAVNKTVSIEKFTVVRDGANGDLLVRFDIRNISTGPGDVSGRIFTVLKPDNNQEDQWLVVPSAPLKKGVPSEYKKGQYFSIAHFKPVKFRIRNQADPDFFKKATIYIFNEQAELIFEELIDITEAE